MRVDEKNWLVEEALRRADQMSMAASVELRVPFLDDEVRALAHVLPRAWKVDAFTTKKVLRDAFRDVLPKELFTQPKRGWFSPGAKWLRRPEFVALATEVFDPNYTDLSRCIETEKVRALWDAHVTKKAYHYTELWALITILMWAKEYNVTL
jgi:asparagine synthase (glutamine-hydrolysing)